jgi:hypothetical protein
VGDIINTQGDWALADLVDSGFHLTVLRQLVKARDKRTTGPDIWSDQDRSFAHH